MLSRSKENLLLEDSDPGEPFDLQRLFYYDDEFIKNVALLKQQYRTLDNLSAGLLVGQKNKADILAYMDDIEGTLVDIRKLFIGYRLKTLPK